MVSYIFAFCVLNFVLVNAQTYICSNKSEELTCSDGLVINITEAYYGRENNTICSTNTTETNSTLICPYRNVRGRLARKCEGASNCTVFVRNLTRDQCLSGPNYLLVDYDCVNASSIKKDRFHCGSNQHYSLVACDCLNQCQTPDFRCYPFCRPRGRCVCNMGYSLDPITKTCVGEGYCPISGNLNRTHEEYTNCANKQRYCTDHPIPIPLQDGCIPGYQCAAGYFRDCFRGTCVTKDECTDGFPRYGK